MKVFGLANYFIEAYKGLSIDFGEAARPFIRPTEGGIFLDGIDLREYSIEDLSKEIGIIFQDFVRYEISARENIGVGRIEEISNELRVSEAARKSLADAVVAKLPNGFHPNAGAPL